MEIAVSRRTALKAIGAALLAPNATAACLPLVPVEYLNEAATNFRTCDICWESVIEDIWANRELRQFYHSTDGDDLDVCEHCVGKFAEESSPLTPAGEG